MERPFDWKWIRPRNSETRRSVLSRTVTVNAVLCPARTVAGPITSKRRSLPGWHPESRSAVRKAIVGAEVSLLESAVTAQVPSTFMPPGEENEDVVRCKPLPIKCQATHDSRVFLVPVECRTPSRPEEWPVIKSPWSSCQSAQLGVGVGERRACLGFVGAGAAELPAAVRL